MRLILLALVAVAYFGGARAEPADPTISVTGLGRVAVAPDMATVRLGVVTEALGAREAIDDNSRAMDGVMARLSELGLEPRDVQTADYSVQPRWNRTEAGTTAEIAGFVARNILSIRVRDLDRLGEVLDAVTRDGANAFEMVQFGLADPGPVEDQARRAAVKDARARAVLYADAAGVTLGPLLRLSEAGGARPPQPMARAEMAMASDAVPIAPGELTVTASVSLVYAIDGAD